MQKGNYSRLNWQDLYLDGYLDPRSQFFCEETQSILNMRQHPLDQGWGYSEQDEYIEDAELEWYMKLNQGKIKRKV